VKIVITGKSGLLGTTAIKYFSEYYEVIGLGRDSTNYTDISKLHRDLTEINPDIILHCAANTNVEKCEVSIDEAMHDNVMITQNIANYCTENDRNMIFISSTGIYGNAKNEPYNEFDKVNATTVYHQTKVLAEEIVMQQVKKHLIVRTGWLFTSNTLAKKNFILGRYNDAKNTDCMQSDKDQVGNPTFDNDLIIQIHTLIEKKMYGIFNCVNEGTASRFDFVKEILNCFNLDVILKPVSHQVFKRKAAVSINEAAINYKLNLLGLNRMGYWKDSLAKAIDEIKTSL
jgi:dTDP-4-dehydrorhamnose reductase